MQLFFLITFVNGAPVTREYFQTHWHSSSDRAGQCCDMHRYGNAGDGGKMVCDADISKYSTLPLLISIGSNNEFSFETAMHARYPNMEIHVYDGTVIHPTPPPFVTFHTHNVDVDTVLHTDNKRQMILKIDCEGCEFKLFINIDLLQFQQILIEVHGDLSDSGIKGLHHFMTHLNKTHSIFYAEPNIQFSDGNCIEYSTRRRRIANFVEE